MKDLGFKLVVSALLIALWLVTMVSFGNYRAERARCEMHHGAYRAIDREAVCVAPGGLKLIPVDQ